MWSDWVIKLMYKHIITGTNKCKQVNEIEAGKFRFISVSLHNIKTYKTISKESTDKSYLIQLFSLPIPFHAGCKWVKFADISLKSTCLFWSELQAPMWRTQPRHVIRRLTHFRISLDVRNIWAHFPRYNQTQKLIILFLVDVC